MPIVFNYIKLLYINICFESLLPIIAELGYIVQECDASGASLLLKMPGNKKLPDIFAGKYFEGVDSFINYLMDYIKEYKRFIHSYYLAEGVRITIGIALPAIVLSYFNLLSAGIVVSLGAMCISVTDSPGPINHRRNGMLACMAIVFVVSLLTGFVAAYPVWLGLLIFIFCFIFSMIGVFGNRAVSIGISALLVMVLNIDRHHEGWDILINTGYILAGSVWYIILSLLLYSIRPYKLTQQALGDCILATGDYLRIRADFYKEDIDYEKNYRRMLEEQINVHAKQDLVRELLFKSDDIIKQPTNNGRILLMIFLDITDLVEIVMTSYDYESLHKHFDDSEILSRFRQLILELSTELDEIGLAIKSNKPSEESNNLQAHIKEMKAFLEEFINTKRTAENVEAFISLRHILNNIENIAGSIHSLHLFTTYDKKLTAAYPAKLDYDKFVTHTDINAGVLLDNLTLKSNIFRHALRVSVATTAGYIISKFLPLGHSYWILLTIIVILKPAYSLTKKRNFQRVAGTIMGALTGVLLIYFISDKTILLTIMLLFMVGTYSFIRKNYLVSVFFMTPYILLLFHMLNSSGFESVFLDRIIDTGIGSLIAFIANFFLVPAWGQEQIKTYMAQTLEDNESYYKQISSAFTGKPFTVAEYKLSRKNAFVSLANLSDAFSRMLSEPRSKQKNIKQVQQFVILNQMLTSHIASLSNYVKNLSQKYSSDDFKNIITNSVLHLENAKSIVTYHVIQPTKTNVLLNNPLEKRVNELIEKRKEELAQGLTQTETRKTLSEFKSIADQFHFIDKVVQDIEKITEQLQANSDKG